MDVRLPRYSLITSSLLILAGCGGVTNLSLAAGSQNVNSGEKQHQTTDTVAPRQVIDSALQTRLLTASGNEWLEVSIWVKDPHDGPGKTDSDTMRKMSQAELDALLQRVMADRTAATDRNVQPVLDKLAGLGYKVMLHASAPLLRLGIKAQDIRRVASWEEVLNIWLEEGTHLNTSEGGF